MQRSLRTLQIPTAGAFRSLLEPKRFKGVKGGRGSGKSYFAAETLIDEIVRGPIRAACVREIQNSIDDSVKRLLEDKIREFGLDHLFSITEREISGPNDSLIIFRGLQNHTATSIKSLEGFNRCWVEEAQSISQKSLDILTPTFRKGAEFIFTWNPTEESDPVDSFFRINAGDPDFICVEVTYADNPWFPDELRRDMERDRRRDPDKYAHIWLGGYQKNTEARVFKNWRIGDAAEFSHEPPRYYYGADWGFAIDPTVLVRCYIVDQTLYVDREVYRVGCKIEDTPALFDMLDNKQARQWPITADSARPETIAHMRDHGYPRMVPAKKGADSVKEGVEFLKNYDIVVHPDCRNTVDELAKYSYLIDKKTEQVLPKLSDKKNHVIDALRYAVESLRRAAEPPTINVLHIPAPDIEKIW